MGEGISEESARREIAEGGPTPVFQLAHAIDPKGRPFPSGLAAQRAADLLHVGETEPWARSGRKAVVASDLFRPLSTEPREDGRMYRSFLPEDLAEEEEDAVRAFGIGSHHALVRAHVFEVLWVRYQRHTDAAAAIEARFEAAKVADAEASWSELVRNLGRLTTLLRATGSKVRFDDFVAAAEDARTKLLACSRRFAFPVLADVLCNTFLTKKEERAAFTRSRAAAWSDDLTLVAKDLRADPHHGHDSLVVLHAWKVRWNGTLDATDAARDIVAQLQESAETSAPGIAATYRQRALQAALDLGLRDLSHPARHLLMESVKAAIPTFKKRSTTFDLPPNLFSDIDAIVSRSADTSEAVCALAVFPGLLEIDRERIQQGAEEQMKEAPFVSFLPTVQYHSEGKITHRTEGPEGNLERHIGRLIDAHLMIVEAFLNYFLSQTFQRFSATTLFDAVRNWPHFAAARSPLLQTSSARFAAGDWTSAGYIAATIFEAVLRDLVRAGGYHALKVERNGVQMDETLNSLLRAGPTREVLGDGFCRLAEHVLCDPAMGWNLRNEIAHGTVRAGDLTPPRVLLLWLLLLRLTCFVAKRAEPSETPAESDAVEAEDAPPP